MTDRMEGWKDISHEAYRDYILDIDPIGTQKVLHIPNPSKLKVRDSGSHMVIDADGDTWYIGKYYAMKWRHQESEKGKYNEF